ncbi:MAG: DUF87 domain-containing protein [Balneola sp.]
MKYIPSQRVRLFMAILYLLILLFTSWFLFGSFFPPVAGKGLWFYAGLSSLILNSQLVAPHFTKPADSITFSVAAIIGICLVSDWNNFEILEKTTFMIALGIPASVLIISIAAIVLKDSSSELGSRIGRTASFVSSSLGDAKIVFSCVFVYGIILYHLTNPIEILTLFIVWSLVVLIKPEDFIYRLIGVLKNIWSEKVSERVIGNIIAYQTPNVVLIEQFGTSINNFGSGLFINDSRSPFKVAFSVGYIGHQDKLMLKAVSIDNYCDLERVIKFKPRLTPNQTALTLSEAIYKSFSNDDYIEKMKDTFVGLISENSSTSVIQFHVLCERDIEEGRIVEARIRDEDVLFQIIEGLTREDIIRDKNRFGYSAVKAKKLGSWNSDTRKFDKVSWIPEMNAPVFLTEIKQAAIEADTIGHFPRSEYTVQIKDLDKLITHNTAILGILGIGKSMLSIELVERIIAEKKKVICIDLTNQYKIELKSFYDAKSEDQKIDKIITAGETDKDNWEDNPEEGGSLKNFQQALYNDLKEFLTQDKENFLKIYNPSEFFATKQTQEPKSFSTGQKDNYGKDIWGRSAALWNITPVEITSLISEIVLEIRQEEGMTDVAETCLVFEEAHSLVPEWSSAVNEGDKSATNRTARAILQGRKYGLGCLLITQRTANVTKTILNQCNSIFAMRTFDDTGKAFLANYIGQEYSDMLSSLKERQAVFYGRSSSCEDPVLIRLNDRDDFTEVFRKEFPVPVFPEINTEILSKDTSESTTIVESIEIDEENAQGNNLEDIDDDLPF